MKINFVNLAGLIILLVATFCGLAGCNLTNSADPAEVATIDKSAKSPSGKYEMAVIQSEESGVTVLNFRILDQSGVELFTSPDRFTARHTTYFLWDSNDRVWVYSGDIGTYIWTPDETGAQWEKQTWATSNIEAPPYLKTAQPDLFNKSE